MQLSPQPIDRTKELFLAEAQAFRKARECRLDADFLVVGGGMAGTCSAITAAREGLRVVLVQDRPVLGGNGSSEVRLWTLGATCHMYSNNRWAREGGVIDEILVENMHRNPEGNALIFDTVLLEKVISEPNITLLLNTAVFEAQKSGPDRIASVRAFCSQNSTLYEIAAPLFMDASGDGILGFLSGAAFRMGAESKDEFGEKFAPDRDFGGLLGHSIYFYSKDAGRPVKFVPPSYALHDIEGNIPRYKDIRANDSGCRLWWIEYGGRLDTVHDTEKIKWELWRVAYGVWNYIKNSGKFPEAANLTLEWIGQIPGKRESRRFEGDYILRQQDVVEQREHPDAVAFGGWALDLHPADGVYSKHPGCTHEHTRGIYQIPYRTLYSRNIENLFLGGRTMSVSHVAFGSTRVMATLSHCGQAIAHAAALCHRHQCLPRHVGSGELLEKLHLQLLRSGQHIPRLRLRDPENLASAASLTAGSEWVLKELKADGPWLDLGDMAWAQMLPVEAGTLPKITARLDVGEPCHLLVELRSAHHPEHHTPSTLLATRSIPLDSPGERDLEMDFDVTIDQPRYVFVCFRAGVPVRLRTSRQRGTGLLSLHFPENNRQMGQTDWRLQKDKPELGIIGFEKWCPVRRPAGENLALRFDPPLRPFRVENLQGGLQRPTNQTNAWVADPADPLPSVNLAWKESVSISRVELFFDTDYDHPAESVLLGHPENDMPFCVRHYRILDEAGNILAERADNHQTRNIIVLKHPVLTRGLHVEILAMCGDAPAAIFEIRCYENSIPT